MGSVFDDALRLMTGYHEIRGRAAEIGRGRGSWIILAEHFFLGMLHDGGGKCMEVLSRSVDLGEVESAVLAILDDPGYALPPGPGRPVPMIQNGIWGVRAAVRMGHTVISVDHAFLDLIRQRDTVPARALVRLGLDLDAVDTAVVEAMTVPAPVPDGAVFLPDGQEFDDLLYRAVRDALPRGTGLSVSPHGDRPWLKVPGPYDTAEILNAALAALGRAGGARPLPRRYRGSDAARHAAADDRRSTRARVCHDSSIERKVWTCTRWFGSRVIPTACPGKRPAITGLGTTGRR